MEKIQMYSCTHEQYWAQWNIVCHCFVIFVIISLAILGKLFCFYCYFFVLCHFWHFFVKIESGNHYITKMGLGIRKKNVLAINIVPYNILFICFNLERWVDVVIIKTDLHAVMQPGKIFSLSQNIFSCILYI